MGWASLPNPNPSPNSNHLGTRFGGSAAAAGEARGAATLVELGAQLASASWLSRVRARVRVRIRVRTRVKVRVRDRVRARGSPWSSPLRQLALQGRP